MAPNALQTGRSATASETKNGRGEMSRTGCAPASLRSRNSLLYIPASNFFEKWGHMVLWLRPFSHHIRHFIWGGKKRWERLSLRGKATSINVDLELWLLSVNGSILAIRKCTSARLEDESKRNFNFTPGILSRFSKMNWISCWFEFNLWR